MKDIIVVRGGGDIATGTIHRLHRSGYPVLVLEMANPSAIRRKVAFCEAVFDGVATIDGVTCQRAATLPVARQIMAAGMVALLVDEKAEALERFKPKFLVDAILAKRNLGTNRHLADFTVALGPGFCAGKDVDCVVETMRGHELGRLIYQGPAMADTGVPGLIAGIGRERVIHADAAGCIENRCEIGDFVEKGQTIAMIGAFPVEATISGILRGIIRDGYPVHKGLKIADIDPRADQKANCFTISDKARCIAGGVLEAVLAYESGVK